MTPQDTYDTAGHGLDKAGPVAQAVFPDTVLLWHSHLSRLQPGREDIQLLTTDKILDIISISFQYQSACLRTVKAAINR